uniref:SOS response-associated peptidase family protein n=1 Tax=Butyrivibrio sp. TaxID=28121 RepID=UPI0025EEC65F
FYKKDKKPIYLAGFYELSDNKDSFVILTTSANESMIRVHDRMPLMIDQSAVKDWLYDTDAAKEMLSMEMPLLESHQDYEQLSLF